HYAKRSVMTLTLPVAMKAVGSSNQELVRNTTSYISLAAIHNGKALSHYALQIIAYIINGKWKVRSPNEETVCALYPHKKYPVVHAWRRIMGNIGRVSQPLAADVLEELVRSAQHTDDEQLLSSILTEIE
ncbi:hypothetical protein TELCIR_19632, partial [Teladorsagia circumcincta]